MRKRFTSIVLVSMFFINSFNVFAQESKAPVSEGTKQVIVQLEDTLAWVDGEEYTLTALPVVREGTTYLPVRFMGDQLLEANVSWDPATKEVAVTKQNKRIVMKIGSQEAFVNDQKVELMNAPMVHEGSTYLPLRTMAELFEIQTDYDQVLKRVTLTKEREVSPILNKAPTAQFYFEKEEYTESQIVKAIDNSFDEDGDAITSRLWMVNFNEKQANSQLENIFSKPKAGTYSISLKAKDEKGLWSEWTTRQITIKPNQKPVVTMLMTSKESYAAGENIEFTYTYDNEPWENVISERWTYRHIDESGQKVVAEKPKFIFHEGEYVVTLQLEDAAGNWSDRKEVIVSIEKGSTQSELEYRFTKGNIGEIIDNFEDFNYRTYKEIFPDETKFGGGTLLMSNSPEDVKANGILYKDTVRGQGRILFHHNNTFVEENNTEIRRLVLVAENTTDQPVDFIVGNKIIKGPATDTLYVGQRLLFEYLKGDGEIRHFLNPGEKMYIYDSGVRNWKTGDLISGKMDIYANGEVTFTVAAVSGDTKIDDIATLPVLARDIHSRGTYDVLDIYHKVDLVDDEPNMLLLGVGNDEWVDGYDAMDGQITKNRGNYGITYSIEITAKTDTGIILNPRAGVFRGAVRWDGSKTYLAPTNGYISGHNSKAIMLGTVKAGETRTLEYVLPNGSASPVLLGFIPKDHWGR